MLYVARVLTPAEFGLVAMANLAIGLGRMVEDLGLDAVIVQDRTLGRNEIARLGGLAVAVGLAFFGIYAALALPIAGFFGEPIVASLIVVLGITFVTDSLQIVPRALLQRDLAFRRLAWINFMTLAVQALTLGAFAALGLSYWSLVLNAICAGAVTAVVLNALRPHPLGLPVRLRELSRPIGFGWRMIVSRIAWYGYSNADSTIVGKLLGKSALGAYSFAITIATVPVTEVTSLISRVVPGVFSEVQHDRPALRRYYLVITEAISLVTLPMLCGLALTADDAVAVALGPQWGESVAPLRILCGYLAVLSVSVLISHVLVWTGRAHANMLLNLLSLIVIPLFLYMGAHYGLEGIAWAWLLAFPISNIPGYWIVLRLLDLRFLALLKAVAPALQGCLAMAVIVLLVRALLDTHTAHVARLAIEATAGALAYGAYVLMFHRQRVQFIYRFARGHA